MSQTSIIFTYAVEGRILATLMNKVVRTRSAVRLTVTTASKKKGLKKLVIYTIERIKTVGRYVVNNSLIILLFSTTFRAIPSL